MLFTSSEGNWLKLTERSPLPLVASRPFRLGRRAGDGLDGLADRERRQIADFVRRQHVDDRGLTLLLVDGCLEGLANALYDDVIALVGGGDILRGRRCFRRRRLVCRWLLLRLLGRVYRYLHVLGESRTGNCASGDGCQQGCTAGRRECAIRLTHLGPLLHESFFFFCWSLQDGMSSQLSMPVKVNFHTN
jgi:hypothetical protein